MSYGVKYRLEFSDVLTYEKKVEILKKNYSGSVNDMIGQAEPVVIKWNSQNDFYKPIIGSVCSLNLFITDSVTYDNFYEYDEREYQIKVSYKDSSSAWQTYWIGFIVVDRYKEEFKATPTAITLKAYDGLGTLNNYDAPLNTSSSYWNSNRVADILDNLGLDLEIWVQADIYPSYDDNSGTYPYVPSVLRNRIIGYLTTSGHNDQLVKGNDVPKCKDQLEGILTSYNCRIYQSYGRWYVVENSNIFDSNVKSSINSTLAGGGSVTGIRDDIKAQLISASAETINTFKYNSSGVYQSTSQESILRICPTTLKNVGGDLTREYLDPFAKAIYILESSQINKYFYNDNMGFEFGDYGFTINSTYASIVTNSNTAQGNASIKLTGSAPSSGTTEMFRNTLNTSQYWRYYHGGNAELSFFSDLNDADSSPTITVQFSILAYSTSVSPNTTSWDDVNETWGLDGSDYHVITRDFNVHNNWHTITVPMTASNISTATQFNVGIVVYNCTYSSSDINDIYFDNVGIVGGFNMHPGSVNAEAKKLPTKFIEYAENNTGKTFSKDYEQKGIYYFNGTQANDFVYARTRDYGLNKTCLGRNLQNIMNDYRDFVVRYEGTFRNQDVEPLTFNNRIWFNFGASVFQDSQSCYIDGLEYKVKSANAKVIAHLPNDDDDISVNLRITTE